jgi:hypothetical protein
MTVLGGIRDRFSGRHTSTRSKSADDDLQGDPRPQPRPPYPGYDQLKMRQLMDGLSAHSQIELEAAETYERSHKDREPVLTKLRYMRGPEPLPGYDALSVEEIVAALKDADLATIRRVRAYERKFGNRPDVLEEVARVYRGWRASQPGSAAAGYQSLGGAVAAGAPVGRADRGDRP